MGGVAGNAVEAFLGPEGSRVMASNDGLARCERVPSRRMSPYVRSAWIKGTSSTLSVRESSWSSGPPNASSPETIVSQGSCGDGSGEPESGAIASCTKISRVC